jgi:hypothetical protein
MRCCCCNKNLSDYESTRKSKSTGEYLDMCNKCYGTIEDDLDTEVNQDLSEQSLDDEGWDDIKEYPDDEDFDGRYEN